MSGRRIIAAAVRYRVALPYDDGDAVDLIVSSPRPGRHGTCIHGLYALTGRKTSADDDQGFLTSDGEFVGREEGCRIAREAGQITRKHGPEDALFSEDMW
jgi:hypothetical protein